MNVVYFIRGAKHAAMGVSSMASVKRIYPRANILIFTDEDMPGWDLWPEYSSLEIHHIAPDNPIMLANLEAQVASLAVGGIETGAPMAFLDTDIIVTGDLFAEVRLLHDLVATWRDYERLDTEGKKVIGVTALMPYNYGVVLGRYGRGLLDGLVWIRERIRGMQRQYQDWYGNQIALAQLLGPPPDKVPKNKITALEYRRPYWNTTAAGAPIGTAMLPCEIYNYTPARLGEDITGKAALHFKGHSRPLMESYVKGLDLPWMVQP